MPRAPRCAARVTQVLGLLDLAPEVVEALAALGDPLPKPIVTERGLRSLLNLSSKEQKRGLEVIASKVGEPVDVTSFQAEHRACSPTGTPSPRGCGPVMACL